MKTLDKVIVNDDRVGHIVELLDDRAYVIYKDYTTQFVGFDSIQVIGVFENK